MLPSAAGRLWTGKWHVRVEGGSIPCTQRPTGGPWATPAGAVVGGMASPGPGRLLQPLSGSPIARVCAGGYCPLQRAKRQR